MGLLPSAMGHFTGLSGLAMVRVGPEEDEDDPGFEQAARNAPSVGAVAASSAARAKNCRRFGPDPLGMGIVGLPGGFASCSW